MEPGDANKLLDVALSPAQPGCTASVFLPFMPNPELSTNSNPMNSRNGIKLLDTARCPALPGRAVTARAAAPGERRAKRARGRSSASPKGEPVLLIPGRTSDKTFLFYHYCLHLVCCYL